jgi:predicted acyl esterase
VCNIAETASKHLKKKEEWCGEMEHRRFDQYEVQREVRIQQLSDVPALLCTSYLDIKNGKSI